MGLGLAITAFVSYGVVQVVEINPRYALYLNSMWWVVMIFQMFLGLAIAATFVKFKPSMLGLLYLLYTAVNGLWIGPLLIIYEVEAVILALVATVLVFIVMAGLALFTNINFLKAVGIVFFGLLGIIAVSFINMFLFWIAPELATTVYWGLTYFSVMIFTVMIGFNIFALKKMSEEENISDENANKFAIIGAFNLYLNIINLFISLLRIFGRRG